MSQCPQRKISQPPSVVTAARNDTLVEVALPRGQAVVLALYRAVDEFEYESIRDQLPQGYDSLFDEDALAIEVAIADALAVETGLDNETALEATESVLETMGEAENIAAYLAEPEAAALVDYESPAASGFDFEEFVERIAQREDADETTARDHAERVVGTLDRIAHGEMDDVREQLGPGYSALFPA